MIKVESVTEAMLQEIIPNLHPVHLPFIILEAPERHYMQCAGDINQLTVEARFYTADTSFKHFVIGTNGHSKVWHQINCAVGPINVLGHEVLNCNHALELFSYFLLQKKVKENYSQRNVTKRSRK
ncbi:MAG: hypothetical protein QM791_18570 [Ferruginibacter sp.]